MLIAHPYNKKVLPNGLTLLTVPIGSATSVTMSVFYKVGSRYEETNLAGSSHFLEHLHFKGCKKYPTAKWLSEVVDSIGGEFNANTGKEHTQYFIRAAYEHLPLIFDVLTCMLQSPLFEEKEMEREKGVIIEEINMYKDNPQIHVESLFEQSLWPDHPLGSDIAGSAEVIRGISRNDIISYREKYYQPNNMIIAVAGHFDQEKLEGLIEQHWSFRAARKFGNCKEVKERQSSPQLKIQNKNTEQAHMIVGFRGYPYRHKNNFALRILSAVLGGGMSSRLFLRVRERMGLAYYVGTSFNNYLDAGNFLVQAGLKISSARKALEVILDELRKIKDNNIKESELKKAKEYLKGKIALSMEDPQDRLEWYLGQEAFLGRIKTIKQAFEALDNVTLEQVHEVAWDLIRNDKLHMALIGPFPDAKKFEEKLRL